MPGAAVAFLGPISSGDRSSSGTRWLISVTHDWRTAGCSRSPDQGPTSCRVARASRWHGTITTLAEAASRHPDRFRGFAHLPMHSPDAAADELERTIKDFGFHGLLVNGPTDGRFLDDPMFEPILARAEALGVPIYIHPGIPPGNFGFTLALSAWGWHMGDPRSTYFGWF